MIKFIKIKLQQLFEKIGVTVRSSKNEIYPTICRLIKTHQISSIIDVGANKGQFAQTILSYGLNVPIISIEPLAEAHQLLKKNSRKYQNWFVAPPTLIAGEEKIYSFNECENSVSSSINDLDIISTDRFKNLSSGSNTFKVKKTHKIRAKTLSSFINQYNLESKNNLLKLDVQGAELEILASSIEKIRSCCSLILTEVSPISYNSRDWKWWQLLSLIENNGYEAIGIWPTTVRSVEGYIGEYEIIYSRKTI